jgi:hypothetical protein
MSETLKIDREGLRKAERLFATLDERRKVRDAADGYFSKVRLTADNTAGRVESIGIDKDVALKILNSMVAETEGELDALGFDAGGT